VRILGGVFADSDEMGFEIKGDIPAEDDEVIAADTPVLGGTNFTIDTSIRNAVLYIPQIGNVRVSGAIDST